MNANEYERMFAVEDAHWWYVALHSLVVGKVRAEHDRKGGIRYRKNNIPAFFLFPFISCYRLALKPFHLSGDKNINIGKFALPFGTSVFAVAR